MNTLDFWKRPYIEAGKYVFCVIFGGAAAVALVKGGYNLVRGGVNLVKDKSTDEFVSADDKTTV